jgi:vacuolar-type H+-ATPase subunit E/Vma4
MALQDILNAITSQADESIRAERAAHQKRISQMREAAERAVAKKKQELALQKDKKKKQMRMKTQAHADTIKRSAILNSKRALLDKIYEKVLDNAGKLADEKIEPILRKALKEIHEKGKIFPSKRHEDLLKKLAPSQQFSIEKPISSKGGFLFVSEKQEQDFTFEHLVSDWLRPKTELETSTYIFSA